MLGQFPLTKTLFTSILDVLIIQKRMTSKALRMATTKIPEELFDLVDENCKPLGVTKARSLVHRDG